MALLAVFIPLYLGPPIVTILAFANGTSLVIRGTWTILRKQEDGWRTLGVGIVWIGVSAALAGILACLLPPG